MFGSQQGALHALFRRLLPDDLQRRLPKVDEETLTPVFPVDAAWVDVEYIAGSKSGLSLNATAPNVNDADSGTDNLTWGTTGAPNIAYTRAYFVWMALYGTGTVTPIQMHVSMLPQPTGAAYNLWRGNVANPGSMSFMVQHVPPTWIFNLNFATNGGAGDLAALNFVGVQAPPGVPLPPILEWADVQAL